MASFTQADPEFLARMRDRKAELDRQYEIERREKVESLRAEASDLGAKLMAARDEAFTGKFAGTNPDFVSDPAIDVLEIRYRRAVSELEQIDVE